MASDLPIRLVLIDGKPIEPTNLNADPAAFITNDIIKIGDNADGYIVKNKQLVVDPAGSLSVTVTLKRNRLWFKRLDEFAAKHDFMYPLLGMLLIVVIGVIVGSVFYFLAAPAETQMAYAGLAIVRAPWALGIGAFIGLYILSNKLEKSIGQALGVAVGMLGVVLGIALALLWNYLFLPGAAPQYWPADYVQLAKDFRQHSASLVAVGAVYAPILLLVLKFLHLDFIGTIASIFVKKKSAD
jgi:hypothetical protein